MARKTIIEEARDLDVGGEYDVLVIGGGPAGKQCETSWRWLGREDGSVFIRVDAIIGPALPPGLVSVNVTGIPDLSGVDAGALTAAEMEGRRQVFEYLDFFRESVPGFECAEVSAIAAQVGVRETRRVRGDFTLGEQEILEGRKFPDAIALGAWPVELHDPKTGKIVWKFLETEDDYYTIPIGCLVPKGAANLLVAGRCILTTHVAQASTRVIGQALAMGEAAGIWAARCADAKKPVREIGLGTVRAELERYNAVLEA